MKWEMLKVLNNAKIRMAVGNFERSTIVNAKDSPHKNSTFFLHLGP